MSSEEACRPVYRQQGHAPSYGAVIDHTTGDPAPQEAPDATSQPCHVGGMDATARSGSGPSLPSYAPSHASDASCADSDVQYAFRVCGVRAFSTCSAV